MGVSDHLRDLNQRIGGVAEQLLRSVDSERLDVVRDRDAGVLLEPFAVVRGGIPFHSGQKVQRERPVVVVFDVLQGDLPRTLQQVVIEVAEEMVDGFRLGVARTFLQKQLPDEAPLFIQRDETASLLVRQVPGGKEMRRDIQDQELIHGAGEIGMLQTWGEKEDELLMDLCLQCFRHDSQAAGQGKNNLAMAVGM